MDLHHGYNPPNPYPNDTNYSGYTNPYPAPYDYQTHHAPIPSSLDHAKFPIVSNQQNYNQPYRSNTSFYQETHPMNDAYTHHQPYHLPVHPSSSSSFYPEHHDASMMMPPMDHVDVYPPTQNSKYDEPDVDVIKRFDPNQFTSAFNMVLIGPPRQGKSTIIANFLSLFRDRFVFVFIFAEPETAEELKLVAPAAYVYSTFEPQLIENLISGIQYVYDNTGTKVPILLYFDDMMMESKVKNHQVFNSLFKTIHHLDISVWMCIHRLYDLSKQQRPAMHLVGITNKITDELADIHKEVFSSSIPDMQHFRRAYHDIITDRGQCLFSSKLGSGNRIGDSISFFKSVPRSELAPFTLMHPDVYYLLAMFSKTAQDRTMNIGGLATHDAYRSALNLPKQEGQLHVIQPPIQRGKNNDPNRPVQPLYFEE